MQKKGRFTPRSWNHFHYELQANCLKLLVWSLFDLMSSTCHRKLIPFLLKKKNFFFDTSLDMCKTWILLSVLYFSLPEIIYNSFIFLNSDIWGISRFYSLTHLTGTISLDISILFHTVSQGSFRMRKILHMWHLILFQLWVIWWLFSK